MRALRGLLTEYFSLPVYGKPLRPLRNCTGPDSYELDWRSVHHLANLLYFLDFVALDRAREMHDILAPDILRLCTFKELQITHTCGYHCMWGRVQTFSWERVDICDVLEIQSEQRHLIDCLEKLVTEFEGKYKELNVLLPEFLSRYWRTRMDEVQAEEEVFDEHEAQRMREIGVIVEYPSSDAE